MAQDTDHRDPNRQDQERKLLNKRYRADKRFKVYTMLAMSIGAIFLVVFLSDLFIKGVSALRQTEVLATITYTEDAIGSPEQAFSEELRPVVSRTRIRQVPHEAGRWQLHVDVAFTEQTAARPAEAMRPLTFQASELQDPAIAQGAPYTLSPAQLRRVIVEQGLEQIRETARANPELVGQTRRLWLWARSSLGNVLEPVERDRQKVDWDRLISGADRARRVFDAVQFGNSKDRAIQQWVLAKAEVDQYLKGKSFGIRNDVRQYETLMDALGMEPTASPDVPTVLSTLAERVERQDARVMELGSSLRNLSAPRFHEMVHSWNIARLADRLHAEGRARLVFNTYFFSNSDSQHPEAAGIFGAVLGSVMILALVFVLAVPIGVMTSIYLEEFAPDNLLTQTIEVNINNLAAIPSILFGVLGLYAFINVMGMPRASALVGGVTLALMTLPIVIIATRAALRAVPDSIRRAGFAMGATRWQVVTHHVLPQSISGILTGSIIGLAQAMGETAPLIIIGLVGFAGEVPSGITDTTTALPAQIFDWWGDAQNAFSERAALGIICLLVVLFAMNAIAVYLRARSEKRW